MNYKEMSYLELFKANYKNETPEAKMVMAELATLDTGKYSTKYAKWGLMEMAMMFQDPESVIEVITIKNDEGIEQMVHTQRQESYTKYYDADNDRVDEVYSTNFVHFVVIRGVFKGVERIERYPILDNRHNAVKFPNAAHVNAAIQRGQTRMIARLTGLAFELYTQYSWEDEVVSEDTKDTEQETEQKKTVIKEDKTPKTKATPKKETKVEPKKEQEVVQQENKETPEIYDTMATFLNANKEHQQIGAVERALNNYIKAASAELAKLIPLGKITEKQYNEKVKGELDIANDNVNVLSNKLRVIPAEALENASKTLERRLS